MARGRKRVMVNGVVLFWLEAGGNERGVRRGLKSEAEKCPGDAKETESAGEKRQSLVGCPLDSGIFPPRVSTRGERCLPLVTPQKQPARRYYRPPTFVWLLARPYKKQVEPRPLRAKRSALR